LASCSVKIVARRVKSKGKCYVIVCKTLEWFRAKKDCCSDARKSTDVHSSDEQRAILMRKSFAYKCSTRQAHHIDTCFVIRLSDDDDIDEALQVEEQQHLHMDSAMNLMFTQLLQQQASYINHSSKTE
jgi:hypothetical protein